MGCAKIGCECVGQCVVCSCEKEKTVEDLLTKVGRVLEEKPLFEAKEKVMEIDLGEKHEDVMERLEAECILADYGVGACNANEILELIDQDEKNEESESIHNWLFAAMERLEMC